VASISGIVVESEIVKGDEDSVEKPATNIQTAKSPLACDVLDTVPGTAANVNKSHGDVAGTYPTSINGPIRFTQHIGRRAAHLLALASEQS
jgi:hypothetical protein